MTYDIQISLLISKCFSIPYPALCFIVPVESDISNDCLYKLCSWHSSIRFWSHPVEFYIYPRTLNHYSIVVIWTVQAVLNREESSQNCPSSHHLIGDGQYEWLTLIPAQWNHYFPMLSLIALMHEHDGLHQSTKIVPEPLTSPTVTWKSVDP